LKQTPSLCDTFGPSKNLEGSGKKSDKAIFVQPFKIIGNKKPQQSPITTVDSKAKSKSVMATAHTIASLNALANYAR
jgi:hypothetical protein